MIKNLGLGDSWVLRVVMVLMEDLFLASLCTKLAIIIRQRKALYKLF